MKWVSTIPSGGDGSSAIRAPPLARSHTPLCDGARGRRYYELSVRPVPRPRGDPDRQARFRANTASDAPECLGWGQTGGADGGQQAGQGTDDDRRSQAAAPGFGRDDDGLAVGAGVGSGGGRAADDSGGAPGQGQQDRFGQELDPDLAAGGAQRPAQPDLGAAV